MPAITRTTATESVDEIIEQIGVVFDQIMVILEGPSEDDLNYGLTDDHSVEASSARIARLKSNLRSLQVISRVAESVGDLDAIIDANTAEVAGRVLGAMIKGGVDPSVIDAVVSQATKTTGEVEPVTIHTPDPTTTAPETPADLTLDAATAEATAPVVNTAAAQDADTDNTETSDKTRSLLAKFLNKAED